MFRKKSGIFVSGFSFGVRGDSLDFPPSNAENFLQDLITIAVIALLRALFSIKLPPCHILFDNFPMNIRCIYYHSHLAHWCIGAGRTFSLDARFEKGRQRLKLDGVMQGDTCCFVAFRMLPAPEGVGNVSIKVSLKVIEMGQWSEPIICCK